MPQLIGLVIVGAGIWAGVKALQRLAEHVTDSRPAPEAATVERAEKDLGRLVLDPESGVYRPIERGGQGS
jgi:hypothetical protein